MISQKRNPGVRFEIVMRYFPDTNLYTSCKKSIFLYRHCLCFSRYNHFSILVGLRRPLEATKRTRTQDSVFRSEFEARTFGKHGRRSGRSGLSGLSVAEADAFLLNTYLCLVSRHAPTFCRRKLGSRLSERCRPRSIYRNVNWLLVNTIWRCSVT